MAVEIKQLSYISYTLYNHQSSSLTVTLLLEALPSIGTGGVIVSFYGPAACAGANQGHFFQVEFLQDFGTLPLMVPNGKNLGPLAILTVDLYQAGE